MIYRGNRKRIPGVVCGRRRRFFNAPRDLDEVGTLEDNRSRYVQRSVCFSLHSKNDFPYNSSSNYYMESNHGKKIYPLRVI